MTSNENKMSDGGRERVALGVGVVKSSQKWSAQRSALRSIAWLGLGVLIDNHYRETSSPAIRDQR